VIGGEGAQIVRVAGSNDAAAEADGCGDHNRVDRRPGSSPRPQLSRCAGDAQVGADRGGDAVREPVDVGIGRGAPVDLRQGRDRNDDLGGIPACRFGNGEGSPSGETAASRIGEGVNGLAVEDQPARQKASASA
jgi:hypothetical protein